MNCEKCFAEHNGNFGSGRFCSIHCARSYASLLKQEEINRKVSLGQAHLKGLDKDASKTNSSRLRSSL